MHLVPYRRTRRLAIFAVFLTCGVLACIASVYWLSATRYDQARTTLQHLGVPFATQLSSPDHASLQFDIDEPDARLKALRANRDTTYLAYLPHSGLHNQRISLENALTLARLLNRTLLVPPARLGAKTLRYVRSNTLARMLELSDKRRGRSHCAHLPAHVPWPDECVDYMSYTLVPWAWLMDLRPIAVEQSLVRVSNGTTAWIGEWLGVHPNETLFLPDTEPYQYQFVDTSAPVREGDKYHYPVSIDGLSAAPHRLIQLGTLFGSSRLRLRIPENRRVRSKVRRYMTFANEALTLATESIGEALGGTFLGVHVRVGDGRFQDEARANVRAIWWKLVRDALGLESETALGLEKQIRSRVDGDDDEIRQPPETIPDLASLRVPHPPISPLPDAFSPRYHCRNQLYASPGLRHLNIPLFIATDAPDGLDNPLLEPLVHTFPCTYLLDSFKAETAPLEGLWNGYDGVQLVGFLAPIVDALVMGKAWAVIGTKGSTFSRYVEDVLWRVSHGWEIVERG